MTKTTVTHVYGPEPWSFHGNFYVGRPMPMWWPTAKHPLPDWFEIGHIWRVGEGHPLANPFKLNAHITTRDELLRQYTLWVKTVPRLDAYLGELRGHTLACWCKAAPPYTKHKEDMPCHADVLAAMADGILK